MKKLLLILLAFPMLGFSQDIIFLKNGDELKSIVLEVNENSVRYKKFTNQKGPAYTKNTSEILIIKYANGEKDIFNNNDSNSNPENMFKLAAGELIALYLKESISSADLTSGSIIRFGVKYPIVTSENKVIVSANTMVTGRVNKVKGANWAGQKGELSIQINHVKAVDGTNIPVYYNLNNQGESKSVESIGIGILLFWPALLMKGKQATVDAGTVIQVETMSEVVFDVSEFPDFDNTQQQNVNIGNQTHKTQEIYEQEEEESLEKIIFKPKREDFEKKSDYKRALKKYREDKKYFEPKREDFQTKSEYKKAMRSYYEHEDYYKYYE